MQDIEKIDKFKELGFYLLDSATQLSPKGVIRRLVYMNDKYVLDFYNGTFQAYYKNGTAAVLYPEVLEAVYEQFKELKWL